MSKTAHRLFNLLLTLVAFIVSSVVIVLFYLFNPWWPKQEPAVSSWGTVGSVLAPEGYERVKVDADGFAAYLRSLPLLPSDSLLRQWDGSLAEEKIQSYNYRCIDLPLLSENEQCADVCIRFRAEYLYSQRRFLDIHFDDTQFHRMQYWRGGRRQWFERYLHHLFTWANTESMVNEMLQRPLSDLQIGDVFVYDWRSRDSVRYGHAIMVVDVVEGHGERLFMLAQGSTPACTPHILHNKLEPEISPWFRLDTDADTLDFGYAKYLRDELRYFSGKR